MWLELVNDTPKQQKELRWAELADGHTPASAWGWDPEEIYQQRQEQRAAIWTLLSMAPRV